MMTARVNNSKSWIAKAGKYDTMHNLSIIEDPRQKKILSSDIQIKGNLYNIKFHEYCQPGTFFVPR